MATGVLSYGVGILHTINVFWLIISPSPERALHVSWLVKAIPKVFLILSTSHLISPFPFRIDMHHTFMVS